MAPSVSDPSWIRSTAPVAGVRVGPGCAGSSSHSVQVASISIAAVLAPLIRSAPSRTAVCDPAYRQAVTFQNLLSSEGTATGASGWCTTGSRIHSGRPSGCCTACTSDTLSCGVIISWPPSSDQARQQRQVVGQVDQRRARRALRERGGLVLLVQLPDPVPDPEQFQVRGST